MCIMSVVTGICAIIGLFSPLLELSPLPWGQEFAIYLHDAAMHAHLMATFMIWAGDYKLDFGTARRLLFCRERIPVSNPLKALH